MIRKLCKCPFCSTRIAFDVSYQSLVFNPDSNQPTCDHVVWIDGSLNLTPASNHQSTTRFRWIHPEIKELDCNAHLGEYLNDMDASACDDLPGWKSEFGIETTWECETPTVEVSHGFLDVLLIFSLDPAGFVKECLANIERSPRSDKRGPIGDWWTYFAGKRPE